MNLLHLDIPRALRIDRFQLEIKSKGAFNRIQN